MAELEIHMQGEQLTCSCCGKLLLDNPILNCSYGVVPYPHDIGYGICRECGGEDVGKTRAEIRQMTEAQAKVWFGASVCMIAEARFDIVRGSLNETNQAKWDSHLYGMKVYVVTELMQRGLIF